MPKGLWVKLCLTNLTIVVKHNLTMVVKHELTTFVKHLTIVIKHWLTIFVNMIFGTPSGTHFPFHFQLCFLYINFCVVNRSTNGSPSDFLLSQASHNYTKNKWLLHDIHPWSPFHQALGTKWWTCDQHPSFINFKDFEEEESKERC